MAGADNPAGMRCRNESHPAHRRGHSPSLHHEGVRNTRMRFIYLEMLDIQKKLVPRKGLHRQVENLLDLLDIFKGINAVVTQLSC
jgi:hypothetical protein